MLKWCDKTFASLDPVYVVKILPPIDWYAPRKLEVMRLKSMRPLILTTLC